MEGDGIERDGIKPGDVAVVTGGGGGFGRAFCQRFARGGAKVAVWDVDARTGEDIAQQVRSEGGEARFFKVDLAQAAEIDAAVRQTLAAYGTPYCVMPDVWELTLKVNITAPFLILRAFGPGMIGKQRGVVINIASGRALEGAVNGANYACSKAAILSLTKSLALEWARHNIRVNAIIPGVSLTAQPLENTTPDELIERGKATIPLGRLGYPEDMAGLAAFLASPEAAYMTGQGLAMNGGRVLIP